MTTSLFTIICPFSRDFPPRFLTFSECNLTDSLGTYIPRYYTGQLPHATVIPYRTGPIHVVGGPADKIFRAAIDAARQKGKSDPEGWVNANRFYGSDAEWRNWLGPDPYNLTNFSTGFITNLDGSPSPQVHQFDRFGRPFDRWLQKMVHEWNS